MTRTGALLIAAALTLLAGCTAEPATQPPPPPPAESVAPQEPTPVTLGQWFDIPDETGTIVAKAAFTALELDPPCSTVYGGTPPPSGHYMEIRMRVQTTAAYSDGGSFTYPSAHDFDVVPTNGPVEGDVYPKNSSDLCLSPDREAFGFAKFAANGDYEGWVVAETQHAAGRLVFVPHFFTHTAGWTISYPA